MKETLKEFDYKPLDPSERKNYISIIEDKLKNIPTLSEKEKKPLDIQVGGNHYKKFKIQPVEFCQKNKIPYCESNVIKYICRHEFKNGLEDLMKAKHYIDLLIQMEYSNECKRLQTN